MQNDKSYPTSKGTMTCCVLQSEIISQASIITKASARALFTEKGKFEPLLKLDL